MTEAEIEKLVDEHFGRMDRQVRDWSPEDALMFMEYVSTNADDRIAGLKDDIG